MSDKKSKKEKSKSLTKFLANLSVDAPKCTLNEQDVHDDFKREAAFKEAALEALQQARRFLQKAGIPMLPPAGYACEMIKTEEQMLRVKRELDNKAEEEKQRDTARRQRELKKVSKQVQLATLAERQSEKRAHMDKLAQLRKKRKQKEDADDLDLDVEVEEDEPVPKRTKAGHRQAKGGQRQASSKRQFKDGKYGFGGKKSGQKRNDRESTDKVDFSVNRNRQPFAGMKGKRPAQKHRPQRPGKARRQQQRSKGGRK